MTTEDVYRAWAPDGAKWSPWVKPVVFAHLPAILEAPLAIVKDAVVTALPPLDLDADGATAVVIDLPAALGVELGLALAPSGFRPVPLYNSVPLPGIGVGADAVAVDMREVMAALQSGAKVLADASLPSAAPPAFLLDARRRRGDVPLRLMPGTFDNRSISLPTDFPSATTLQAAGVKRAVVLVPAEESAPQNDLSHTLRRWQDGGIQIQLLRLGVDLAPRPIVVQKPHWYRHAWHALLVRFRLRPHLLGGFGGFLPEPSAG